MFSVPALVALLERVWWAASVLASYFLVHLVFLPTLSPLCFVHFTAIPAILEELRCAVGIYLRARGFGQPKSVPKAASRPMQNRAVGKHSLPAGGPQPSIICASKNQGFSCRDQQHPSGNVARPAATAGSPQPNAAARPKEPKVKGRQNTARGGKKRSQTGKRRKTLPDSEGEGSGGEESDPDDSNRPGGEVREPGVLFACPFYKFDPEHHFRCLGKYHLKNFKDVKEHCIRRHVLPVYYCSHCWTRFEKSGDLTRHNNDDTCTKNRHGPEDLYREELYLLDTDSNRHEKERWYEMWDNIFKGYPRPASPYLKPGFSEPLEVICQWLQSYLPEEIPSLHQRHSRAFSSASYIKLDSEFLEDVPDTQAQAAPESPPTGPTPTVHETGAQSYIPRGGDPGPLVAP
ncbi:hypothetical protein GQ53DRAFT_765070 [Thozetella sp. PMI_491]|nr:hypothetical protein GQ53DRAFT_765070 [Thozetella sp. PMI_491]